MTEPTERDREMASYWATRGDFATWLAGIIATAREEGRHEERLRWEKMLTEGIVVTPDPAPEGITFTFGSMDRADPGRD